MGLKWVHTSDTDSVLNDQEVCFCFGYFSRKLDSLMVFGSFFNELCHLFSGCALEGADVVNESFPDERF